MGNHLVVAIDGPAGAGKSTVALRVAQALGCMLLDTGAIYRSLALVARERRVAWHDEQGLAQLAEQLRVTFALQGDRNRVYLEGRELTEQIRCPEISRGASEVSALPAVRRALLEVQRSVSQRGPLVAEGRDIGTVVFPDAAVKVYLVADPQVRAERRHRELVSAGQAGSLAGVLQAQNQRDAADAGRAVAPLCPAEDAHTIDTSTMSIAEVVEAVLELVREARGREAGVADA